MSKDRSATECQIIGVLITVVIIHRTRSHAVGGHCHDDNVDEKEEIDNLKRKCSDLNTQRHFLTIRRIITSFGPIFCAMLRKANDRINQISKS